MQKLIKTEDNLEFYDMTDDSPCSKCGLCCKHFRVSFPIGEIDGHGSNINVPISHVVKLNDFRAVMKGTDTVEKKCIAFKEENGYTSCAIYQNRPSGCREFPVWEKDGSVNPKCNELRKKAGLSLIQSL